MEFNDGINVPQKTGFESEDLQSLAHAEKGNGDLNDGKIYY